MKKLFAAMLFAMALAALLCMGTAANNVTDMNITAVIGDNGDMDITQKWTGSFDEGTENYILINNSGYLAIENFTVSDEDGAYTYKEWDIDESFSEKSRYCGIVEYDDRYELCWGISDYAEKTYTVSYTVTQVAGAYTESDGFNFRFINDEMNVFPTNASITIRLANGTPLSETNCGIWAFGYDGQIVFEDGEIHAYTQSALEAQNHMTIMTELSKGLISPERTLDYSFSEVMDKAFEGSDYQEYPDNYNSGSVYFSDGSSNSGFGFEMIIVFVLMAAGIGFVIFAFVKAAMNTAANRKFYKETDYFRDVPNGGVMNGTYELGMLFGFCDETGVIGAMILRLVNCGCLEPETEQKTGIFGRTKEMLSFRIKDRSRVTNASDLQLFDLLGAAAGEDGILQEKELKRLCNKNPETVRKIITDCAGYGENWLLANNCFVTPKPINSIKKLTERGAAELREAIGLKKYLADFSLIGERGINEAEIWKDYLLYAVLYGIADKVIEQLKIDLPDFYDDICIYEMNVMFAMHYSHFAMETVRSAEAERSAGSGGSASFGGGGGFSGGGSGGGSR